MLDFKMTGLCLFFIVQEPDADQPLNDSGCLLEDSDLFETGLEEENDSPVEDEESLESIRAAVKSKMKNHKASEEPSQPSLPLQTFALCFDLLLQFSFFNFISKRFVFMYVSMYHMHTMPMEARRGHWIP